MTSSPLRPYAAYLRVYEPIRAFPQAEREQWRTWASTRAGSRSDQLVAEHWQALVDLLSVPPRLVPPDETGEAFVLEVEDEVLVCPVQSRLRSWVALGELREGLPDALVHAFVPPASLERAERDHETWAGQASRTTVRILTATWAVPVHWFVAFSHGDRRVEPDRASPSLVYLARMSAARRRVGRALRTLRRTLGEVAYADDLEQLGRWLEEFHPRSWVELDYAGLARLVGVDALGSDTSARDVTVALDALAAGDRAAAEEAHTAVVDRWARLHALEHAN